MVAGIKACIFDVFGTVVDWRTSVSRDLAAFAAAKGVVGVDWVQFADAWRKLYRPSMDEVRSGRRPWTILDVLHLESLAKLVGEFGIKGLSEADLIHISHAWRRLDPWPDAVPGLTRLKTSYIIAPCSNGNIALMVNMAKHAGLPWDCVLGAEPARAYKPDPEAYLASCRLLDLEPWQVLMVAAHNGDLRAAKAHGLRTAFVPRLREYGPDQQFDVVADPACAEMVVESFTDLATRLDC
jgi:2-haloacid dehalogenase